MKQKKRTETEQSHKVRISLLSISLLILFMMVFISCNNDKKLSPAAAGAANFKGTEEWPIFKLNAETILSCEKLRVKANTLVVLKHQLVGIEDDGRVEMNLYGFSDANHANHGKGKDVCFNTPPDDFKKLNGDMILGNNYIDWGAIASAIFKPIEGDVYAELKDNFNYVLFEPENKTKPGCPKCNGHLWYKIKIYIDGKPIIWKMDSEDGSSNPSPPADPMN